MNPNTILRAAPALSVIVPTYNERDRLEELARAVFEAFAAARVPAELVLVDDNSPDGTGALADRLAGEWPLAVVHRAGKLGLGTAVIEGFGVARAPVLGVMDGDLSHPPDLLPVLLRALDRTHADMAIGSRYVPGGGAPDWSRTRLLMSRVACLLARGITPVRDATSGFFLIRREATRDVQISAGGFKICLELLVRGRVGSVVEVPYTFAERTTGQSKMNRREALGYLVQLRDLYGVRYGHAARRPRYHRVSIAELPELGAAAPVILPEGGNPR